MQGRNDVREKTEEVMQDQKAKGVTRASVDNRTMKNKKFTPEEDEKLKELVKQFGEGAWRRIAESLPGRNRKQVRERYVNFLRKERSPHEFSPAEDTLILNYVQQHGRKWNLISEQLPGRTAIMIKNRYYARLRYSPKNATTEKPEMPTKNPDGSPTQPGTYPVFTQSQSQSYDIGTVSDTTSPRQGVLGSLASTHEETKGSSVLDVKPMSRIEQTPEAPKTQKPKYFVFDPIPNDFSRTPEAASQPCSKIEILKMQEERMQEALNTVTQKILKIQACLRAKQAPAIVHH